MEQLETDENLIEKKQPKNAHYVLIGVCCFVLVVAGLLFFKIVKCQKGAVNAGKYKFY